MHRLFGRLLLRSGGCNGASPSRSPARRRRAQDPPAAGASRPPRPIGRRRRVPLAVSKLAVGALPISPATPPPLPPSMKTSMIRSTKERSRLAGQNAAGFLAPDTRAQGTKLPRRAQAKQTKGLILLGILPPIGPAPLVKDRKLKQRGQRFCLPYESRKERGNLVC